MQHIGIIKAFYMSGGGGVGQKKLLGCGLLGEDSSQADIVHLYYSKERKDRKQCPHLLSVFYILHNVVISRNYTTKQSCLT